MTDSEFETAPLTFHGKPLGEIALQTGGRVLLTISADGKITPGEGLTDEEAATAASKALLLALGQIPVVIATTHVPDGKALDE